jgi:hypothetical protein
MGIWVRSQNRHILTPVNDCPIQIYKYDANSFMEEDKPENISFEIVTHGHALGTYPTEAEAIAVLDEIEEFLKGPNSREIFTGEYPKAFQMPEAGFSAKPKKEFTHEMYLNFVTTLQSDGYTDIPSEDEWRAKLVRECTIERGCR